MNRLLKVLVFLCFFAFVAADHLEFAADLTVDQEVPPPDLTPNNGNETTNGTEPLTGPFTGVGVFWFSSESMLLTWNIDHTIANAQSAHIHGPAARGVAAGPIITLNVTSPIVGEATLTQEQWGWLSNGSLYVNIHNEQAPNGIIRGQIESAPLTFAAFLTGANVVPPSTANHNGTAIFKYKKETKTLSWDIVHPVATATSAGLHGPADDDETAPVIFTFLSTALTPEIKGSTTLTSEEEEALLEEKFYVQINSTEHPNGDIRGQVIVTGEKKDGGLSAGVIVLIVFIVIAAVLGIGAFVFLQIRKRRKQRFEVVGSPSGDYVPPNF